MDAVAVEVGNVTGGTNGTSELLVGAGVDVGASVLELAMSLVLAGVVSLALVDVVSLASADVVSLALVDVVIGSELETVLDVEALSVLDKEAVSAPSVLDADALSVIAGTLVEPKVNNKVVEEVLETVELELSVFERGYGSGWTLLEGVGKGRVIIGSIELLSVATADAAEEDPV